MKMTGTYERTCNRLLAKLPKPQLFGYFMEGHFQIGHKSQHKTARACRYRMFLRMRQRIDLTC